MLMQLQNYSAGEGVAAISKIMAILLASIAVMMIRLGVTNIIKH